MSNLDSKLDATLVWDDAGHLADPAVNALADGELALLPVEALAHVDHCEQCGARVGQVALFALELDGALSTLSQAGPAQQIGLPLTAARASLWQRLPVGPLSIALVTAVLGMLPSLHELAPQLLHSANALPLLVHFFARMLSRALGGNLLGTFAWLSTAFLLLASAAIARWARTAEDRRAP